MTTYAKAQQGLKNWLKGQSTSNIKKHMTNWSSDAKILARREIKRR